MVASDEENPVTLASSRVWYRCAVAVLLASGPLACVRAEHPASQPAESQPAGGLPAPFAGLSDEGTFSLVRNEERLITMKYKLSPDGAFEGEHTLAFAGQSVHTTMKITPDAEGRWELIEIETVGRGTARVVREGTTAKISAKTETKDETWTETIKPDTVLFENYLPVFYSQAVRRYDRAKGGKQEFPVFIIPARTFDASLEFIDTVERAVAGRDMKFHRFTYGLPGVDVILWTDDEGKIYLGDVPAQRAAYIRDGYESLRQEDKPDPLLSQPTHEVVEERGVKISMRDGIELSTDIFKPAGDGPFPVILTRTPYKKEMSELDGRFYARRGYAMAIQDVRGRFGSAGAWEPFVNEKEDGYDTIEWLAKQPWSNGKVGMIGASYLGWVQWWAASQKPPHLVTIVPNVSPPDPFYNFPYEHGVFFMWGAIWWADIVEKEATADLSGAAFEKIMDKKYDKLLRELPVIELDKSVLGSENRSWRNWIEHNTDDDYWARADFLDSLADVRIPVFHQSGWFDGDGIGSKLNYLRMASHGHPHQKLILGPWGHTAEAHRSIGEVDFGPEAIVDLPRAYLRWFDHWLKGIDNGIDREPLVSLFVMNTNKWVHGPTYPLPQTQFEKWYFSSDGDANTSKGNGKLTRDQPTADAPPDRYAYDPGDPTPNPDFFVAPEGDDEKKEKSVEAEKKAQTAYHQGVTDSRRDMLVYTTEPFEQSYTFVGPISAVLYASSSAKDTDWFVRLVEIEEDGETHTLVEGRQRARFRNSMKKPELIEPGKVYEYTLDLWQTGMTVKPGQRLRVEVSSASFPMFSRNLNTGGHNEKDTDYVSAEQTISHDSQRPSHLLLPMIPDVWDAAR